MPKLRLHLLLCMQNRKPIVDYQDLKEKIYKSCMQCGGFERPRSLGFRVCLIVIHRYGLAGIICQIAVKIVTQAVT